MATFTERVEYKLEIIPPHSIIQCRKAMIVDKTEDGEKTEVGRTYVREMFCPGDDVSNACKEVRDVAAVLWTPEVIAAFNAAE